MSALPNPDELLAQAQSGSPLKGEPKPLIYEQEDSIITLTLDRKQAWVILTLLGQYRHAEEGDWDIYRAAWDVRRRVAEALGYE